MFGYVTINKLEIKFKDYYKFRSYYCGVCRCLKKEYGNTGRIALGYDMTFLAVLLSGLYDGDTETKSFRCIAHPFRKRVMRSSEFTAYAADMNLLLTYYKCIDDWRDERKLTRLVYAKLIYRKAGRAAAKYPEKSKVIKDCLLTQSRLEAENEKDFDTAAGCFGSILAEIFAYRDDVWQTELRRMGFFLGKFIYLLDAYEDVFEDADNGRYNPFIGICGEEGFDDKAEQILRLMISESADAFEMLPIDENMDILRNIIYSGVWRAFEMIQAKRKGKN